VSNQSRVIAVACGLVVIGFVIAVASHAPTGLLVVAGGIIVAGAALRFIKPDSDDDADLDGDSDQAASTSLGLGSKTEPLTPWTPEGGFSTWLPKEELPPRIPTAPVAPISPAPEPGSSWSDNWSNDFEGIEGSATYGETSPLNDLVGFDSVDPIAEVQRIDHWTATVGGEFEPGTLVDDDAANHPGDAHGNVAVNENVTDSADILAASQATELTVADGEQTELQRLLTKVQARLSAYE